MHFIRVMTTISIAVTIQFNVEYNQFSVGIDGELHILHTFNSTLSHRIFPSHMLRTMLGKLFHWAKSNLQFEKKKKKLTSND